jgi:hypothetical protein
MEQSPSREASRSSDSQESPAFYGTQGSLLHSQQPVQNQINPVHAPNPLLEEQV